MKTISVTREQMERCGRALPKKTFLCQKCLQPMCYDDAYKHWAQNCPKPKKKPEV